jgi:CheY-like chemotaxis protein
VFWNLIKNAVKFTPHGGCVGVHCSGDGDGYAVAQVRDSGIGIEPEALSRIFNAFEQVDRSVTQRFGGLGLGLAISKALVELHGGTIEASSEGKGKGAAFTVKLPIVKVADGRAAGLESGLMAVTARGPAVSRPLEILLVEDHGDTARILQRMLQAKGHRVETAGDVATALERMQERSFDLLLSDLGLPDRSGLELRQELHQMGRDMPSIALSGYGQDEDIRRSREAGFAEHLTKPVNFGQLEAAIGRVAVAATR